MIRDRHKAIRIALASLCALAVALVTALAITVSLSDFDLQQSLPSLDSFGPAAIVVLRFLTSLGWIVPTSPLLMAAAATEGVMLGTLYVLIGAQLGALALSLIHI